MGALASILVLVMLGGGVTLAENALPGDLLYPVKVEVNENIQSALAVGAENEGEWNIRQAERRVHEALRLSSRGALTSDVEVRINADLSKHIEEARKEINDLEARGEFSASARLKTQLDARLEAYGDVFARVANKTSGEVLATLHAREDSLAVLDVREERNATLTFEADSSLGVKEDESLEEQTALDSRIATRGSTAVQHSLTIETSLVKKALRDAQNAVSSARGELKAEAEMYLDEAETLYLDAQTSNQGEKQNLLWMAYRTAIRAEVIAQSSTLVTTDRESAVREEEKPLEEDSNSSTRNNVEVEGEGMIKVEAPLWNEDPVPAPLPLPLIETNVQSQIDIGGRIEL
jgi:hypothetical protein